MVYTYTVHAINQQKVNQQKSTQNIQIIHTIPERNAKGFQDFAFFPRVLYSDRPCHNGPPVNQPPCACWRLPCPGNARSSELCWRRRGTWTGIRVSRHPWFDEDSRGLWSKGAVHCVIFVRNLSLLKGSRIFVEQVVGWWSSTRFHIFHWWHWSFGGLFGQS